ncbi:MAG: hypothetical protein HUU35_08505 [Armatimonadetes bacterium]|nr:hypothetical protein [Armatimonadota bacterium]
MLWADGHVKVVNPMPLNINSNYWYRNRTSGF